MDIAVKKRLETVRRKKEAAALIGTPGITKPSGPVGSLKHAAKSSASSSRLPNLSGPAATLAHHARKRSLVAEQLAHVFDDKLASLPGPATHSSRELDSDVLPRPTAPDHEARDVGQPPNHHFASQQAMPPLESALDSENRPNPDLESDGDDMYMKASGAGEVILLDDTKKGGQRSRESATPIALAAPDRPDTGWRGGCPECSATVKPF
jgi:hypothetical protein